eukprot:TRINITY_DN8974_c0_g1_i9.p3 TRINITY_DN8974_c0_g1~~TRINITY_DN8974_c0_g1_i9.p3  ORF type:complete len:136 (+),score=55.53 TRINITY_DN8974_c0_g1_i9:3-410(+)
MQFFFFQAEDGIRDFCLSRGLGDVYKRQVYPIVQSLNVVVYRHTVKEEYKRWLLYWIVFASLQKFVFPFLDILPNALGTIVALIKTVSLAFFAVPLTGGFRIAEKTINNSEKILNVGKEYLRQGVERVVSLIQKK